MSVTYNAPNDGSEFRRDGRPIVWGTWFLVPVVIYSATGAVADPQRGLIAALVLLVAVLFMGLVIFFSDPLSFLSLWVGLLFWQNCALGIWGRVTDSPASLYLVSLSTLIMFAAAGAAALHFSLAGRGPRVFGIPAFLMLLAIATSGIGTDPNAVLGYFRSFAIAGAVVFTCACIALSCDWRSIQRWVATLVPIAVILLWFGAAIQIFLGTDAWQGFVGLYYLPHLGSVSDSTTLFHLELMRVGSLFVEPINAAFFSAGLAIISIAILQRITISSILAAVLVVTAGGKGAIFMILIATILAARPNLRERITRKPALYMIGLLVTIILLGLIYIALVLSPGAMVQIVTNPASTMGRGQSTTYHVAGFISAVSQAVSHPLGHGLGVGGILNSSGDNAAAELASTGGESGLGVLIYQLGWLGVAALLVAVGRVLRQLHSSTAGVVLAVTWLCGCVYQEQVLGPLSSGLLFVGIGLLLGETARRRPGSAPESREASSPSKSSYAMRGDAAGARRNN